MDHTIINERNALIRDLENTFRLALDAGDFKSAIQAKHMIGKVCGFFDVKKQTLSLIELTQKDLEMLITEAEDIKKWQAQ